MFFTSLEFYIFLPIVFAVYWSLWRWRKWQNTVLLLSSYVFYAWLDLRSLPLFFILSLAAWGSGRLMQRLQTDTLRFAVNVANISINVVVLAVFKYYNFFADTLGFAMGHILLPLGISFYVFQAIAYSVDVYRRRIEPEADVVTFLTFMSFFPKVVSGPIERGTTLLPQLAEARRFDYARAVDGCRQLLWGLFKKLVIADACAAVVDSVWNDYGAYGSLSLLVAMILFSFQVYCDLSGYTDIALGVSRLFGIELSRNFNYPYFSRNIPEFWRRWHISLMSWFRDYIYIPLGGSRCARWRIIANTFIVFLISGLWHGSDRTFVCYGLYHGALCSMFVLFRWKSRFPNEVAQGKLLPSVREMAMMTLTFALVTLGRVLFRADDMSQAIGYLSHLFTFTGPSWLAGVAVLPWCLMLVIVEWLQRDKTHVLQIDFGPRALRWAIYMGLMLIIIFCRSGAHNFLYTQF